MIELLNILPLSREIVLNLKIKPQGLVFLSADEIFLSEEFAA
jgi:hypothetical protein